MKLNYLPSLILLFSLFSMNAQNYPGGVTGAEVWYIGDWDDIGEGIFKNSAETPISIDKCGEQYEKELFNFNPSIYSDKLCLFFRTPLENSTGRNLFFVGEPKDQEVPYSHFGTLWRDDLAGLALTDSIIRNFFDLNNKTLYGRKVQTDYSSDRNARVNFYHTNHYNIDKKFKSYGQEGETTVYIGSLTPMDPQATYGDNDFSGNSPEFISFPRELSANERIRVESYLALKYGLTLNRDTPYLNSKNTVFWNIGNNELFPYRIFGFGRDDISGLDQLQSESTHLKDHLVSAVGDILQTNMEKQLQVEIPKDHFLVFGDNDGKTDFLNDNGNHIMFWDKIWLAQRTGADTHKLPIHFKLFLDNGLLEYLNAHPEERLWLLQDKHIGNDELSGFDSQSIDYYPGEIDWENKTAYFRDVFFDTDMGIYDQFTFGRGPQMIVQAQLIGCEKEELEVVLDITGGTSNYVIEVESSPSGYGFTDTTGNTTYSFPVSSGVTYYITIIDNQGLIAQTEITIEPWGFGLDLGPDQYLSPNQPEITLDAGVGINDPDATYQWYRDGVLLPDTGSTLMVNEVGLYEVTVTSGDLSCSISDGITIGSQAFDAHISLIEACDEFHNTLNINIDGGTAPFTTTLENLDGTTNYAHNASTAISDLPYGSYTVTVTDSAGETFVDTFGFSAPPPNLGMDVYAQLQDLVDINGGFSDYSNPDIPLFFIDGPLPFSIDASIGAVIPGMSYEWYMNGEALNINGPVLTLEWESDCYINMSPPIFTVIATDGLANCSATQSFEIRNRCPEGESPQAKEGKGHLELDTKVYPNPSEPNTDFTYEVFATEQFSGTIEVFTMTGTRLYRIEVNGQSSYTFPLNLQSAGVYLIRTVSSVGIVRTDRVIIK